MVLRPGVRTALLLCLSAAVLPAQTDRLAATIDAGRSSVVRGSVPRLAQARYDRGPVDAAFPLGNITLILRPSAAQQAALEELLADLQEPGSPNYHDWLTPEAYAERFGPSAADVESISAWLRSQGFSLRYTARGRDFISFSGTAAQVRSAFKTEIRRFHVAGKTHFANATDLSLPAALQPMVAGILGLNDFHPRSPMKRNTLQPAFNVSDGSHALLPDDLAMIYDLFPLYAYGYTGDGQKIVIVGQSDIDRSDIDAFRSAWDLPTADIEMVPIGTYPGFLDGDEGEADLDLEWAGAVARYAKLIYVFSDDADYSAFFAIDNNLAPVISESFGLCEADEASIRGDISSYEVEAQKGSALGITWLASSGDSGAAGCDYGVGTATHGLAVSLPASIPEVTAVGGAEFAEGSGSYWSSQNGVYGGSALSYIPEIAWNDTGVNEAGGGTLAATGGGLSSIYKKPSWQSGAGVPADGMRDLPDIALAASNDHDPYIVISQGLEMAVGGTSAAAPSFAGMVALLNQFLVANNVQSKPGVGNLNQKLYSLAVKPGVFHDITSGNNVVPCQGGTPDCANGTLGYTAGPGYDLVTGLGSLDAYNLVMAYAALPVSATTATLAANPPAITASGSTVVTATVKAAGGTLSPTGPVAFTVGNSLLGSAMLSGTGGNATASITVFGSQLPGTAVVTASYAGSPVFSASSAAATITIGAPAAVSNVTLTVTPNPVYQHAPDANGATFSFTIQLNETAGVGTELTGFTFDGASYAASIATFFGSAALAAHGSLSAGLSGKNIAVPASATIGFTGRDASGATWSKQIQVPFLPAKTSAASVRAAPGVNPR